LLSSDLPRRWLGTERDRTDKKTQKSATVQEMENLHGEFLGDAIFEKKFEPRHDKTVANQRWGD
jgi:hypothetical protein